MPLSDLSPLSYFKELSLFPRVIFTIGGVLFFASLVVWNAALVLFGVGLVLAAVGFNFMLNSTWQNPGPPYESHLWWGQFLQGLLAFLLAAACFYVATYRYRFGSLPPYLRPVSSVRSILSGRLCLKYQPLGDSPHIALHVGAPLADAQPGV
jgi:hypothetical protein